MDGFFDASFVIVADTIAAILDPLFVAVNLVGTRWSNL